MHKSYNTGIKLKLFPRTFKFMVGNKIANPSLIAKCIYAKHCFQNYSLPLQNHFITMLSGHTLLEHYLSLFCLILLTVCQTVNY